MWSVSLAISDRGRSGLAALQLQKGDGILTLFNSPPPTEDSTAEAELSPHQQQAQRDRSDNRGHRYYHHQYPKARLERGEPPLNISEWALGSSQPLWGRYTSSCCSAQAELLVWDAAGNMKRCHLTSDQQRELRDRSAEPSSTRQSTLTACVCFLTMGILRSLLL